MTACHLRPTPPHTHSVVFVWVADAPIGCACCVPMAAEPCWTSTRSLSGLVGYCTQSQTYVAPSVPCTWCLLVESKQTRTTPAHTRACALLHVAIGGYGIQATVIVSLPVCCTALVPRCLIFACGWTRAWTNTLPFADWTVQSLYVVSVSACPAQLVCCFVSCGLQSVWWLEWAEA